MRSIASRTAAAVAVGGLAVVVLLVAAPLLFAGGGGQGTGPTDSTDPVVPSTVYPPLTGEDSIVDAPPGPAAILIAGDGELRGLDFWGGEGRGLLVSQRGGYRLARSAYELSAGIGGGMLLSPDGRYLAGSLTMEGTRQPSPDRVQAAVFDLVAGTMRQYDGGYPMAWSPVGRLGAGHLRGGVHRCQPGFRAGRTRPTRSGDAVPAEAGNPGQLDGRRLPDGADLFFDRLNLTPFDAVIVVAPKRSKRYFHEFLAILQELRDMGLAE